MITKQNLPESFSILLSEVRFFAMIEIANDNDNKISIAQVYNNINNRRKKGGQKEFDYKAVHKQIKILEEKRYIRLEKNKEGQGQPVIITKINLEKWEEPTANIKRVLQQSKPTNPSTF